MAGGIWLSQNKVRPGAYIRFKSVPRPTMTVGDRGIGTMAIPLTWGPENALIDVYSTDLLDGASLSKVGVTAFDEATEQSAKLLTLMLSNCYLAKIYRLDSGGVQATVTTGGLTAKAKYPGTFGNSITISIVESDGLFTVTTFVAGTSRNAQTVSTIQELEANDYVEFSGFGALTANAGIPLTGGTNGTYTAATAYPNYLALASRARWQTMAVPFDGATVNSQIATFAKTMRDDEGRYVQVALANYDGADFHGVINSDCGFRRASDEVTADEATAWVAGATAGARIIDSNTNKAVTGAISILNERTGTEQDDAILSGKFILTANTDGEITVLTDINSLHTFTPELDRAFSKNRVLRTLDEIGTSVKAIWERSYMGKVGNNDDGRMIFKADLIGYLNQLQALPNGGAITNFMGADDIEVIRGIEIDAVVCNLWVQPVDSMERLYMTVNVQG